MPLLPSRDEIERKFQDLSQEERFTTLVGYLQLARLQLERMMEDNRRQGEDAKAAGIALGHELIADIVDNHYADIANQVADRVKMADAVHRVRIRELLL